MPAPNLSGSFGNPPLNSTPQTSPSHLPQQPVNHHQHQSFPSSPPNTRRYIIPDSDDIISDNTRPSLSEQKSSFLQPSMSTSATQRQSYKRHKPRTHSLLKKRVAVTGGKSHSRTTINSIYTFIRRKGWTVVGFLEAWILEEVETEARKSGRTQRRRGIAQIVLREDIFPLLLDSLQDRSILEPLATYFQPYSAEFNQLSKTHPFRKWQADEQTGPKPDFTTLDIVDDTTIIQHIAPQWTKLIHRLVQPPRHSQPSFQAQLLEDDEKNARLITWMITSMIMHKRTPRSSVFPITSLGLWLRDAGVKDRVIVGLAKLGCCPGVDAINNRLNDLGEYAKVSSITPI